MAPDAYHPDQTKTEANLRTLILNGVGNPQHYPIQPKNLLPDKLQVLDKYHVDHRENWPSLSPCSMAQVRTSVTGLVEALILHITNGLSAGRRREQNLPTSYACSPGASHFMCSEPLALDVTKWWPSAYLHGLVDGMLSWEGITSIKISSWYRLQLQHSKYPAKVA